eukprot:5218097-Prymnesium_polylepis.1
MDEVDFEVPAGGASKWEAASRQALRREDALWDSPDKPEVRARACAGCAAEARATRRRRMGGGLGVVGLSTAGGGRVEPTIEGVVAAHSPKATDRSAPCARRARSLSQGRAARTS